MSKKVESVDNNVTVCYVLCGVRFTCPDRIAYISSDDRHRRMHNIGGSRPAMHYAHAHL